MEENVSKYELYILKEIEGAITSFEKSELDEWRQNPQNENYYQEQKKIWSLIEDHHRMKSIDREKALKRVEKQIFDRFAAKRILQSFEKAAAILFIPLLLWSVWYYYHQHSADKVKKEIVFNQVEVPLGMRSSMTLPDGTSVWLNAGSSLKYAVSFDGSERKVELTGEAYFQVVKDKTRPFVVTAGEMDIRVLGTSFNCCAYPDENNIETALVEGNVEISDKSGKILTELKPGELATFSKTGNGISVVKTNLEKHIAWKSGKLMFRDDPMNKVLEKLGRWYNVEFQVDNQEILGYIYSATFTGESLDQMLKMFALSAPIDYQILPKKLMSDNSYEKQIIRLTTKRISGR